MSNFPEGKWYITVDGTRYTGEIHETHGIPVNCGVSLWKLRTWDKKIGSAMIEIWAPRTRFRKVK